MTFAVRSSHLNQLNVNFVWFGMCKFIFCYLHIDLRIRFSFSFDFLNEHSIDVRILSIHDIQLESIFKHIWFSLFRRFLYRSFIYERIRTVSEMEISCKINYNFRVGFTCRTLPYSNYRFIFSCSNIQKHFIIASIFTHILYSYKLILCWLDSVIKMFTIHIQFQPPNLHSLYSENFSCFSFSILCFRISAIAKFWFTTFCMSQLHYIKSKSHFFPPMHTHAMKFALSYN